MRRKIATRIKLIVDNNEHSGNAVDQAIKLSHKIKAELHPLYVVNTHYHKTPNVIEAMVRTGQKQLERLKTTARNMGINVNSSKVLVGAPTGEILKEAYASKSDLLVVGAGANSPKGSVPDKLLRKAKCNLMLVRNQLADNDYKKILVLTNDNQLEKAPEFAAVMSKVYNSELTACHVVDVEEGLIKEKVTYLPDVASGSMTTRTRRVLGETVSLSPTLIERMKESLIDEGRHVTDSVEKVANEIGVKTNKVVLSGKPVEEIVRYAKEGQFDLIVTEHTKRGRLSQLISGSVPEKVARNAPCSVLIVNSAS